MTVLITLVVRIAVTAMTAMTAMTVMTVVFIVARVLRVTVPVRSCMTVTMRFVMQNRRKHTNRNIR